MVLVSSFEALTKKLVTSSRAKLLIEYISNNDEEAETVEQEPELGTNPNEHEEASNVDEIPFVGRELTLLRQSRN